MDKTGFLKELKRYLAVLNEGEQKDILDEYSQHIDMKMERGMSESEAIKDFGDMEELASDILEAYHVNPQYRAKKHMKFAKKEEIPVAEIAKTGRRFWSKTAGLIKTAGGKAAVWAAWLWRMVKKPFCRAVEAWEKRERPQHDMENIPQGEPVDPGDKARNNLELRSYKLAGRQVKDKGIRRKNMFGEIPRIAAGGIRRLLMAACFLAAWCVRWAWNLFMMFVAFMTGMVMLGSLFGLGVLVVLLIQGYPLAGFMLGCLGLTLCSGALAVIAVCLCRISSHRSGEGGSNPNQVGIREDKGMEEIIAKEVPEHV